jgi:hypothetical protein
MSLNKIKKRKQSLINFDSHSWKTVQMGPDEIEVFCSRCSAKPWDRAAADPCKP